MHAHSYVTAASRTLQLDAIQALRTIAALLVVFDHGLLEVMEAGGMAWNREFAFNSGGLGVEIFFVISGFVMAHSTSASFGQAEAWATFLQRRFVRIMPLYWLVTLLLFARSWFSQQPIQISELLLSLTFIPYQQAGGIVQPINGIGWTLNYEMLFYAVFAVCLLFSVRKGVAMLSSALLLLVLIGLKLPSTANGGFWQVALTFWTAPILLYFLAGIWLGLLRKYLEHSGRLLRLRMDLTMMLSLATIGGALSALYFGDLPRALGAALPILLILAITFVDCRAANAVDSVTKRLGDASYSIYLTHVFAIAALSRLADPAALPIPVVTWTALAMLGSCATGWAVYVIFERPLRVSAVTVTPHAFIEPDIRRSHHVPGVPGQEDFARIGGTTASFSRLCQYLLKGDRRLLRIPCGNEPCIPAVLQHVTNRPHASRHDRTAQRHRFKQHNRQSLVIRGDDHDICGAEKPHRILPITQKVNAGMHL
jgi:exopolysaccharide production protein ExoZ